MTVGVDKIKALLSHVFLYKMFMPEYEESLGAHLWFVSTIFQIYIIFYILIKVRNKFGRNKFLMSCSILSVVWWIVVALLDFSDMRVWNSFFLQYIWEFAMGMYVAETYMEKGKLFIDNIKTSYLVCITGVGIIIYGLMALSDAGLKVFNDVFSVMAFGGAVTLIYID